MKKFLVGLILCVTLFSMCACDKNPNDSNKVAEGQFDVIFFDVENSSDAVIHYDGEKNDNSIGYQGVKPADCYLIKTGNTEILVDAGFQLQTPTTEVYNKRISKIYQENVLPKISSYCTDGVLEYFVVTHGDFDHIAGAVIDGGILDYFYSSDKKIENIIDFDSDLVVYLSNENGNEIFPSGRNRLLESESINIYRKKRDRLVSEKGTKHIPAAAFFKGTDFLEENTLINAMPDDYLRQYFRLDKNNQLTDQINTALLINFYYFSKNSIIHNVCNDETKGIKPDNLQFKSTYDDVEIKLGELREESGRYYYSINLNGSELRILYNWHYDHFYRHSFNSQDRNNISVCLEIATGSKKFLTFGDLGFGESGLLNYYGETSILKGVTCFKASHHGSTTNGENSAQLFQLMQPEIVIVPGVAQINRDILTDGKMTSDAIYGGLSGTAVMKRAFFENVKSGNANTKIYCMQVAKLLREEESGTKFALISAPFYGDLILSCNLDNYKLDATYKGSVECYVSGISDKAKHFNFANNINGELLCYCDTILYKAIYEEKGKI